jgi:hypothetical protein
VPIAQPCKVPTVWAVFTDPDEELARSRTIGVLAHQAIAQVAAVTLAPTARVLQEAADAALRGFRPIEARAHRQNIAAICGSYFWHLAPPRGWAFAGTELHVGVGRVDLVWRDPLDSLLVDELKTGSPRQLGLPDVRLQADRYRQQARRLWPTRFVGLRLLSTSEPRRSLFIQPAGGVSPLHTTPYVRSN